MMVAADFRALNIGCGRVFHRAWTNIDMTSTSPHVRAYDLRRGLPYENETFDYCYTSHVLEHLTPQSADKCLLECARVLRRGGWLRVVVPDLESIARNYLLALERASQGDPRSAVEHKWMTLELYDQTVRSFTGGEMHRTILEADGPEKAFIAARLGSEAEQIWNHNSSSPAVQPATLANKLRGPGFFRKIREKVVRTFVDQFAPEELRTAFDEAVFRNSGEIHRWMYDRVSLRQLLLRAGFMNARSSEAVESVIPDFATYELDVVNGEVRKPDSLFMEAQKP